MKWLKIFWELSQKGISLILIISQNFYLYFVLRPKLFNKLFGQYLIWDFLSALWPQNLNKIWNIKKFYNKIVGLYFVLSIVLYKGLVTLAIFTTCDPLTAKKDFMLALSLPLAFFGVAKIFAFCSLLELCAKKSSGERR